VQEEVVKKKKYKQRKTLFLNAKGRAWENVLLEARGI
jgi:hypothetical protein